MFIVVVVLPGLIQAFTVTKTYFHVDLIQSILLFILPFASLIQSESVASFLLYVGASSFHLYRTILFKYPFFFEW